jgi:hypothetical protein
MLYQVPAERLRRRKFEDGTTDLLRQHPSILPVRSVKKLGLILVVAAAADIFISVFPLSSAPREKDRARLVTEPDVRRLQRAQQLAWFKLWSTVEMRELMAYVR